MQSDEMLEYVISALRAIPHVEIIRLGTRTPVVLPQRITQALCDMLKKYHPIWVNVHFNHPNEITADAAAACARLADAGIPLGNQSVLLAGVNDCVHVMRKLVNDLVKIRVRPYYIYACDLSLGLSHFRTPVSKGIEIIEGLSEYGRPLINNEWLNRLDGCNVADVLPLLYAKRVGSLHWGLMAGFSQTYEPYGGYYSEYMKENSNVDLTKWQHDIYRFNGLPYDKKEIEIFKSICAFADKMDRKSGVLKD